MKIAHIAPPWITIPPKNYGGTEMVIYYLVEEQVNQGHNVTLFAPGDAKTSAKQISFYPKSLIEEGVPWEASLKAYYHLQKAVEYIKAHDFDIVHTHLSTRIDMCLFPLTASLATPHVMTLHTPFPFDRASGDWIGDADRYYMDWVPSVPIIATSEKAKVEVPYDLNFVGVVHHGIPMKEFTPTGKKRGDFFVWLGRFNSKKGAHLAIQAAKQAKVPIVLAGVVDFKESRDYFPEMIRPHIDNEQVKYIGPVSMEQKIDLLSQARGLLNPIEWEEPFGMVMVEAMALGCPVVSFARGAASEIILHRETGFLVQDVDEMAHFIAHIDEIDRDVARAHIERNFSAHIMTNKYIEIYQKVIMMER